MQPPRILDSVEARTPQQTSTAASQTTLLLKKHTAACKHLSMLAHYVCERALTACNSRKCASSENREWNHPCTIAAHHLMRSRPPDLAYACREYWRQAVKELLTASHDLRRRRLSLLHNVHHRCRLGGLLPQVTTMSASACPPNAQQHLPLVLLYTLREHIGPNRNVLTNCASQHGHALRHDSRPKITSRALGPARPPEHVRHWPSSPSD